MTLLRFVTVLLLVTVIAGVVGGGAGALFGLGMPQQVQVQGEADGQRGEAEGPSRDGQVAMQVQADRSPVVTGMAWGAGLGLLIGGPCGLLVALFDQGVRVVREHKGSG